MNAEQLKQDLNSTFPKLPVAVDYPFSSELTGVAIKADSLILMPHGLPFFDEYESSVTHDDGIHSGFAESLGSGRTSRLSSNGCSRPGSRPTRRPKQPNSFAGAAVLRVVRFWITTAPRNLDSLSTSGARIPSIEPQRVRGENQTQR